MVTALSTLTRLKILEFGFRFNHTDWENRSLPLPTRTVLPSLTALSYEGGNEYSEEFMARIDAPLLDHLSITSFSHLERDVVFDPRQLLRFISRISNFQAPDKAHIGFDIYTHKSWIDFSWTKQISSIIRLGISGFESQRRVPLLVWSCHPPFSPLPTLEYLYIGKGQFRYYDRWWTTFRIPDWLELLRPFTAAKNLYLTKGFASPIAHALQDLSGEREMVLPALENVFIESQSSASVHGAIGQFAAARQLSGHPIGIQDWDRTGFTEAGHR